MDEGVCSAIPGTKKTAKKSNLVLWLSVLILH